MVIAFLFCFFASLTYFTLKKRRFAPAKITYFDYFFYKDLAADIEAKTQNGIGTIVLRFTFSVPHKIKLLNLPSVGAIDIFGSFAPKIAVIFSVCKYNPPRR